MRSGSLLFLYGAILLPFHFLVRLYDTHDDIIGDPDGP